MSAGSSLTENITRSKRWRAWQGNKEALRRLCGVVEAFAQRRLEEELSSIALKATTSEQREIHESDSPTAQGIVRDRIRTTQEYDESSARLRWEVRARATEIEYNRTRSGTPDEVIGALDERTVDSFSVDLRTFGSSINVEVSLGRLTGCQVRVYGSDPMQIHSLFSEVESAAKLGVPRWRWLRSDFMLVPYSIFSGLFVAYALYPYTTGLKDPSTANRLLFSLLLGALGGFFLSFALLSLTQRLFPAFEVTAAGTEGKGSRRLLLIITLAAGAVLSWLVNHLR